MEIKEGKPGKGYPFYIKLIFQSPVFEVREENGSQVFTGPSPTAPWTEVLHIFIFSYNKGLHKK